MSGSFYTLNSKYNSLLSLFNSFFPYPPGPTPYPPPADVMTLTTAQTASGAKTFSGTTQFTTGSPFDVTINPANASIVLTDGVHTNTITPIGTSAPSATADSILLTNDTATNVDYNVGFFAGASGYAGCRVENTQFTFNPSTETLDVNDGTNHTTITPTSVTTGTLNYTTLNPPIATPTFDQVLTKGNTSSQTFILSNAGNANGQSGSQIILDGAGVFGTTSTTIDKDSVVITDTNGTGTTLTNAVSNNGMIFSLDDNNFTGLVGGQFVGNLGGTPTANISLGASGVSSPPYPAPNGSIGINATPTTAVVALSQSSPFANASNVNMDLFGINHTQSVGSPSPDNPFTIETNKYLKLKASDAGGSGYGIFIDKLTPNIYYPYNSSNPNDRLVISNNGIINSISVSTSQTMDIGSAQLLFQDFVAQKAVDFATSGLTFQNTVVPAQQTQLTLSQLTFNDSATISSFLNANQMRVSNGIQGISIVDPGTITIQKASSGGQIAPALILNNTNASGSVAMEVYKNKPTAGAIGDVLYNQSVYGKDSANGKQEYTRVTHTIRDPTNGAEDGSIELGCFVNGAYVALLQLNGNDAPIGEVNCLRPLDLNGGSDANATLKTTGTGSVNLNLDATGSAGTGAIALKTKNGVAGSGGGLLLTGNTLLAPTAGGASGQHLALTIGGVVYKIALLNA